MGHDVEPGPVAGMFFYLYLIVEIFSRKIVGWEVQDQEAAELAATLIRQAVLSEGFLTPSASSRHPLRHAIRFVTPDARHAGIERATLASRAILSAKARAQNPGRWSGQTRNWQPAGPVWLNPEDDSSAPESRDAA